MELSPDLNELLGLFRSRNIEFVVVGAHALAHHGIPRFTGDLDILISAQQTDAERIVDALSEFGFGSLGLTTNDFTQPNSVIQIGNPPSRIDILTSISGVTWREALDDSVEAALGEHTVRILGRTTLVANKRATGRTKDLADMEALGEQ